MVGYLQVFDIGASKNVRTSKIPWCKKIQQGEVLTDREWRTYVVLFKLVRKGWSVFGY